MSRLEGFKPTAEERAAISRGVLAIKGHCRSDMEVDRLIADEARGYGNSSDRIPKAAAEGLACSWFLRGVDDLNALLRDHYFCRPAAIWFAGFGAARNHDGKISREDLKEISAAVAAYDAAFARMLEADKAALKEALK
jgi:hypothetical protein